jgi:hypothetical protein
MQWGFQEPRFTAIPVNFEAFDELDRLKYRWFVINFLFAYDEIFEAMIDESWDDSFRYDVRSHIRFICTEDADPLFLEQFYVGTRHLIAHAALQSKDEACLTRTARWEGFLKEKNLRHWRPWLMSLVGK